MSATAPSWLVTSGPQVQLLRQHLRLPDIAADKLIAETGDILALCGDPSAPTSADTGLALGYVQSGKTMSFTTLIAMARDNRYQIVIVCAGISTALVQQSIKRLTKDLQLEGDNSGEWITLENPSGANDASDIRSVIQSWQTPSLPPSLSKRTALIVVMKNKKRLENLADLFESLGDELQGVPTLIVDDEADQAGMNTEAKKNRKRQAQGLPWKASAVHAQLLRLKALLPHHTLVQYTATPQAPLFIDRADDLSPTFIKLLTPGSGYTGGRQFFNYDTGSATRIKRIPLAQVHSDDNVLTQPPATLLDALREYFIGLAEFYLSPGSAKNRSMMVHPSQRTGIHQVYYGWVLSIKDSWDRLLKKPAADHDRQQLINDFHKAYNGLLETGSVITAFERLVEILPFAVATVQVREFNSTTGAAPEIKWRSHKAYILVGGQAMDRGFTVEGLTVTYMPRGLGTRTADTLQQRARFFGYKQDYLSLCRVYLIGEVEDAFRAYVHHENDLRSRLQEYDGYRQLNDFERRVELPSALSNLTRPSVLSDDVEHFKFGGNWVQTRTVAGGSDAEMATNQALIDTFLSNPAYSWSPDLGEPERTPEQRHQLTSIPIHDLIALLRGYAYLSTDDDAGFDMLAHSLTRYAQTNPGATAAAYEMSPTQPRTRTARSGKLRVLFQGQNPQKGAGKIIYPGDALIRDSDRFSLQIHRLLVKEDTQPPVPSFALAVWFPASVGVEMVKLASE